MLFPAWQSSGEHRPLSPVGWGSCPMAMPGQPSGEALVHGCHVVAPLWEWLLAHGLAAEEKWLGLGQAAPVALSPSSTQGGLAWVGVVVGCWLPLCSLGVPRMEGGPAAGLSTRLCRSTVSLYCSVSRTWPGNGGKTVLRKGQEGGLGWVMSPLRTRRGPGCRMRASEGGSEVPWA